jgi:NADH-ubiquinone oxidoreductase chain 2
MINLITVPLIGFFSKQFVLLSAIQNGYYFMAFIAIFVSVISASYYLKIIKIIYTPESNITYSKDSQPNNSNIKEFNENINLNNEYSDAPNAPHPLLTNIHSFIISFLTIIILFFVLKPYIILSSIRILSISIFYF